MATVTTLIQPKEIINQGIFKATPLNDRFDAAKIAPVIHLAEDRFLKTFICSAFYDDLIAQKDPIPSNYNPNLPPLQQAFPSNADYEYLWTQYLLAYLSRAVYYMALPDIVLQTGSNGLFLNNTEFGSNGGIASLKFMQDTQLNNLEGRKPLIINYLCENQSTYPLFCPDGVCKGCYCSGCKDGSGCTNESGIITQSGRDLGIQFY
jgi:hypothetical protein